jgi:hypothetical protein
VVEAAGVEGAAGVAVAAGVEDEDSLVPDEDGDSLFFVFAGFEPLPPDFL